MKVGQAIDDAQQSERDLADQLVHLAERHAPEPDVYHLAHTLAAQCRQHLQELRPFVDRYGADVVEFDSSARPSEPGDDSDRLLADLRDTYVTAQRVTINWTILLQAAKALRDTELLGTVTSCQEQAEGTGAWLQTQIKASAPQGLIAG